MSTCGTPFTHKWAALNSPLGYGGAYGAQPPTHTFTDVTNIVNVFTERHLRHRADQHLRGSAVPERRAEGHLVLRERGAAPQRQDDRRLVAVRGRRNRRHERHHELAGRSRTGTPPSSSPATPSPRQALYTASGISAFVHPADPDVLDRRRHPAAVRHRPRAAEHERVDRLGSDQHGSPSRSHAAQRPGPDDASRVTTRPRPSSRTAGRRLP